MTRAGHLVLDEGVQLERTTLAWCRTTLGLAVVAALLFRYALQVDQVVLAVVVGTGLAAAAPVMIVIVERSYRKRATLLRSGRPIVAEATIRLVAALVWLSAVGALVFLLAVV